MAKTQILTTGADRKEAWEEELYRDTLVGSYFMSKFTNGEAEKFMEKGGEMETSPNDVLHIKTDMGAQGARKTKKGDKISFHLLPRIDPKTNKGVTSGQTLKGKELNLSTYTETLELERYRQAVSSGGPMDWARASWDVPKETKAALQAWGSEKMDLLCFEALEAAPATYFYKTSDSGPTVTKNATLATAKAALTAADSKLTPAYLSYLKTWALTGGGRSGGQVPPRPIMISGKPYYIYLTHPDALFDWKNDSTVMQAYREAQDRGKDNPLFQGADYVWDNVIIHTHEFVTTGDDGGGASITWTYGHLLGAQALVLGFGERPSIVDESEDYEEDNFSAWRMTMKVKAPKFNSKQYGSLTTLISRTNVSGT